MLIITHPGAAHRDDFLALCVILHAQMWRVEYDPSGDTRRFPHVERRVARPAERAGSATTIGWECNPADNNYAGTEAKTALLAVVEDYGVDVVTGQSARFFDSEGGHDRWGRRIGGVVAGQTRGVTSRTVGLDKALGYTDWWAPFIGALTMRVGIGQLPGEAGLLAEYSATAGVVPSDLLARMAAVGDYLFSVGRRARRRVQGVYDAAEMYWVDDSDGEAHQAVVISRVPGVEGLSGPASHLIEEVYEETGEPLWLLVDLSGERWVVRTGGQEATITISRDRHGDPVLSARDRDLSATIGDHHVAAVTDGRILFDAAWTAPHLVAVIAQNMAREEQR